jgi:PKD repeat protein
MKHSLKAALLALLFLPLAVMVQPAFAQGCKNDNDELYYCQWGEEGCWPLSSQGDQCSEAISECRNNGMLFVRVNANGQGQGKNCVDGGGVLGYPEDAPPLPVIITTSLPAGKVSVSYYEYIERNDYRTMLNIAEGSLPPGLVLRNYGVIEGTPTTVGTYTFTVQATNLNGSVEKDFIIVIEPAPPPPPPPVIAQTSLPDGMVNEYYSVGFYSNGGNATKWSIVGDLPPGLEFYEYGSISGTPTTVGSWEFTIKAENAGGEDSRKFTIEIIAQPPPAIDRNDLPNGMVGEMYFAQFGSCFSDTWSIIGDLPPGLEASCASSMGYLISGFPTTVGDYSFTVRLTNIRDEYGEKEFTISIAAQIAPVITTNNLPSGTRGEEYHIRLNSSQSATWNVTAGSLPRGLEIKTSLCDPREGCSGASGYFGYASYIGGIPEEAGAFPFTVQAENTAGSSPPKQFTIIIAEPMKPSFITKTLPNSVVGEGYQAQVYLTGSRAECSVAEGSLPPSQYSSIYSSDGYCGIYNYGSTTAGTYNFTLKAENAAGSVTQSFTIVVDPAPTVPVVITNSLPNGETNRNYYAQLESYPYSYEWTLVNGDLPLGLELRNNQIEGIPTTTGTYPFTVKVGNSEPKTLSITIVEPKAPIITTASLPNGETGEYYEEEIKYSSLSSVTLTLSGNLPPGLNFDNWGYIYGTPKTTGTYNFTVKAENANGPSEKQFSITITAPTAPVITTASLPNGEIGYAYVAILESSSRSAIWSITDGSLPLGLNLDDGGRIRGIPVQKGDFSFTVKAENSTLSSEPKQFTINISDAATIVTISTTALPNGAIGIDYGLIKLESTSPGAFWTLESGALPPGLYLSSGYILGTPETIGVYTFTVKAFNANDSDTKTFTVTIGTTITPIISKPQLEIATGNLLSQTLNGISLHASGDAVLEIYGLKGNLVSKQDFASGEHIVSMSHLPKGMYIARASFGSERKVLRVTVR